MYVLTILVENDTQSISYNFKAVKINLKHFFKAVTDDKVLIVYIQKLYTYIKKLMD